MAFLLVFLISCKSQTMHDDTTKLLSSTPSMAYESASITKQTNIDNDSAQISEEAYWIITSWLAIGLFMYGIVLTLQACGKCLDFRGFSIWTFVVLIADILSNILLALYILPNSPEHHDYIASFVLVIVAAQLHALLLTFILFCGAYGITHVLCVMIRDNSSILSIDKPIWNRINFIVGAITLIQVL